MKNGFRPLLLSALGFAIPPPSASLVSPAGGVAPAQPTYVWTAVSASTEYLL